MNVSIRGSNLRSACVSGAMGLLVSILWSSACFAAPPSRPSPQRYRPFGIAHVLLERYRMLRADPPRMWRDSFPGRGACWVIEYTFVWSDESASPGHRPGTEDPEPVRIFVADDGGVLGYQIRVHWKWLPPAVLAPWDFAPGTQQAIVGFAANVHTPGVGIGGAVLMLGLGPVPQNAAQAWAAFQQLLEACRRGRLCRV